MDDDLFVTYQMADGSEVWGEYTFVTEIDNWFDDRNEEVVLIRKRYRLVDEETITLPDPYPIEDEDDDG